MQLFLKFEKLPQVLIWKNFRNALSGNVWSDIYSIQHFCIKRGWVVDEKPYLHVVLFTYKKLTHVLTQKRVCRQRWERGGWD